MSPMRERDVNVKAV